MKKIKILTKSIKKHTLYLIFKKKVKINKKIKKN